MKEFVPWIICALFNVFTWRLIMAGLWANMRYEKFYSFLVEVKDLPFSDDLLRGVFSYRDSLPTFDQLLFSFRGWKFDHFYPDIDAMLARFLGEVRLAHTP